MAARALRWRYSKYARRYYLECEKYGHAYVDPAEGSWRWCATVPSADKFHFFRTLREAKAWSERLVRRTPKRNRAHG